MKIPTIPASAYVVVGVGVAAGFGYVLYKIVDKIRNPNKGTPYEGTGAVGTAANVVNTALGGAPQAFGESLGEGLFNLIGPDFTNANTFLFKFRNGPNAGKNGAVNADEVDEDTGVFVYRKDGLRYKLQKGSDGTKFATKV